MKLTDKTLALLVEGDDAIQMREGDALALGLVCHVARRHALPPLLGRAQELPLCRWHRPPREQVLDDEAHTIGVRRIAARRRGTRPRPATVRPSKEERRRSKPQRE